MKVAPKLPSTFLWNSTTIIVLLLANSLVCFEADTCANYNWINLDVSYSVESCEGVDSWNDHGVKLIRRIQTSLFIVWASNRLETLIYFTNLLSTKRANMVKCTTHVTLKRTRGLNANAAKPCHQPPWYIFCYTAETFEMFLKASVWSAAFFFQFSSVASRHACKKSCVLQKQKIEVFIGLLLYRWMPSWLSVWTFFGRTPLHSSEDSIVSEKGTSSPINFWLP